MLRKLYSKGWKVTNSKNNIKMIKPVNPRHHIVTYMPLNLLMFLIKKKVLSQWINNVLNKNEGRYTAPEIIRLLKNDVYFRNSIRILFQWRKTPEGIDFWNAIDSEWARFNFLYINNK